MSRPIRMGDVVRWHPDAGLNVEWTVTGVARNTLTIEVDLAEGDGYRTVRKSAKRADCILIGEQLDLLPSEE